MLRVLRHGLPPNVRTLCLCVVEQRESSVAFLDLLPSLPQSLVALHYVDYTRRTDADTRVLLSHFRQLRCMALRCTEEAAEYLASGEVKQTLLLNSFHTPERLQGALVAAGHKIGTVRIGVDWRRRRGAFQRPIGRDMIAIMVAKKGGGRGRVLRAGFYCLRAIHSRAVMTTVEIHRRPIS